MSGSRGGTVAAVVAIALVAGSAAAVTGTDVVTTFAGTGASAFNGDGLPAAVTNLAQPLDVEVGSDGDVYVAEQLGQRVRRIDAATGVASTVAGTGTPGTGGDGGPAAAAQLAGPTALALDGAGNLYIGENGAGGIARLRRVDAATATIVTLAVLGAGHFVSDAEVGADGQLYVSDSDAGAVLRVDPVTGATAVHAAGLAVPTGLAVAASGLLYAAETAAHRVVSIGPDGSAAVVVGSGTPGSSGDGGPAAAAELNRPVALAVDAAGDLYVGEWNGYRVRKVDGTTAVMTTVAGNGSPGYSGDGGPAVAATFETPAGLALDAAGDLYVSDTYNHRIRRVEAAGDTTPPAGRCVPGTNRSGKSTPNASAGFRLVSGADNVGVASIVVADTASPFVSMPIPSGGTVKLTQSPGGPARDVRPGPGVIVAQITTIGDPVLRVTDSSGNVTEVSCGNLPPG